MSSEEAKGKLDELLDRFGYGYNGSGSEHDAARAAIHEYIAAHFPPEAEPREPDAWLVEFRSYEGAWRPVGPPFLTRADAKDGYSDYKDRRVVKLYRSPVEPAKEQKMSTDTKQVRPDGIPRRSFMPEWTRAERAIFDAMQLVESAGADERLTKAVILLGDAQAWVADCVDGVKPEDHYPRPASPVEPVRESAAVVGEP